MRLNRAAVTPIGPQDPPGPLKLLDLRKKIGKKNTDFYFAPKISILVYVCTSLCMHVLRTKFTQHGRAGGIKLIRSSGPRTYARPAWPRTEHCAARRRRGCVPFPLGGVGSGRLRGVPCTDIPRRRGTHLPTKIYDISRPGAPTYLHTA